jgi:hypothetical protein
LPREDKLAPQYSPLPGFIRRIPKCLACPCPDMADGMGVVCLLIWGPLVEFVVQLPLWEGLTLAYFIVMIALFLLNWRLRRRRAVSAPARVGSELWPQ